MKKTWFIVIPLLLFLGEGLNAQVSQTTTDKREKRKNLTVKQWNTSAATKTKFLDHVTIYDEYGRKTEETEYANYGKVWKIVYEYDASGRCSREVEYDGRGRVTRIRKFEYHPDGTKKVQYNYLPNGKLETTKEFEYIYK